METHFFVCFLFKGAGESGKSTISKQMKIIHLDGFSEAELLGYKPILQSNVIETIKILVNACDELGVPVEGDNAALAEMLWPGLNIGKLVEGAVADIIFVDYHATTPLSVGNLPWHIIFGFESSLVTTTMVGGKLLMHNRELLTLDEAEITARSRELATQVWQRYETIID